MTAPEKKIEYRGNADKLHQKIVKNAIAYGELVKLGHTLFALPFALSAVCLAYLEGYSLSVLKLVWIVLAFTAARSAAMGFNRVVDAKIDAANPRTLRRPTVTGEIGMRYAKLFTFLSAALFLLFAWLINPLCFALAFPALAVLLGYSYAKRFTWGAHYVLGIALALAPTGAWIAVTGNFSPAILALSGVLMFHIAGFDLIYSLQDMEFDIANGLHSIPAKFGVRATLLISGASFAAAVSLLVITGWLFALSAAYFSCVAIIAAMYAVGQIVINRCGMKRVNEVFFYLNVLVSALIFVGIASNLVYRLKF